MTSEVRPTAREVMAKGFYCGPGASDRALRMMAEHGYAVVDVSDQAIEQAVEVLRAAHALSEATDGVVLDHEATLRAALAVLQTEETP